MSALGQKRTSEQRIRHVRFTPESGHAQSRDSMSAKCQKQTLFNAKATTIGPFAYGLGPRGEIGFQQTGKAV